MTAKVSLPQVPIGLEAVKWSIPSNIKLFTCDLLFLSPQIRVKKSLEPKNLTSFEFLERIKLWAMFFAFHLNQVY